MSDIRALIEKLTAISENRPAVGDGVFLDFGSILEIDTESSVTFLGFEEQQEERKRDRVKELLEKRKQREQEQKQS